MLMLSRFSQNTSFLTGTLEPPEGTVQCFVFSNFYFRHNTFPPSAKTIKHNFV